MCKGTTSTNQEAHRARNPSPGPKRHLTPMIKGTTPPKPPSPCSSINVGLEINDDNDNDKRSGDSGSICELCGSAATLYCQADDAYLCGRCDGWVHGANFLANRHVRCLLCDTCHRFSHRFLVGTSRHLELPEVGVGGKRSRRSHCDGTNDCSSLRILKRPFVFI